MSGGVFPPLTDEEIVRRLEILKQCDGSKRKAAAIIGIERSALRKTLARAAERGLDGSVPGNVVPEGFIVREHTVTRDAEGNVERTSVKTRADLGEEFKPMDGQHIARQSVLTGPDGRVILKWSKTDPDLVKAEAAAEIIKRAFENYTPAAPTILSPRPSPGERLAVYILADWHVGLFSYGRETGTDWDLSIAKRVLLGAMRDVVDQTAPAENALVLGLGDLLHADNSRNVTERSGNALDVDTRYPKCLETVCDLVAETVEMVASKHGRLEATFKAGNHDENSTVGIRQALRMAYRSTERVAIDVSPDPFYWRRHGINLIGGAHGHTFKLADAPLIVANLRRNDWADTLTRHFHTGHIHHDTLHERGGVHVYSHRAPVAQDAFHHAAGYLSGRSMRSFAYDANDGFKGWSEQEIR